MLLSQQTITTGDINGDNIPDLLINSRGAEQFTVLLGYGNGSFRRLPGVKTGKVPLAIIPADFNNDKRLDVAVTLTFDKMEIFLGSGNGSFSKGETYQTGSRPFSGVAGDFNGDKNIRHRFGNQQFGLKRYTPLHRVGKWNVF